MKHDSINSKEHAALTVQQLAKTLQIGRNAAYNLIHSGQIRSITIGRNIRIPQSALMDYLNRAD